MIDVCPFQTLAVIDLLRLVERRSERNRPPVPGNLFHPGCPAVGEHEVRLRDPQLLHFLLRFHNAMVLLPIIDANFTPLVAYMRSRTRPSLKQKTSGC